MIEINAFTVLLTLFNLKSLAISLILILILLF